LHTKYSGRVVIDMYFKISYIYWLCRWFPPSPRHAGRRCGNYHFTSHHTL